MPATPPARPTAPTTKLATYADLYRTPEIVDQDTDQHLADCRADAELLSREGSGVTRGPGDATRRHHDLDMQVRCGDGIRPVPANLREPQTTGGLRADTMVLERRLIPKPCLGQVLGVIEVRRQAVVGPHDVGHAAKMSIRSAAQLNAHDGVMILENMLKCAPPPPLAASVRVLRHARGHRVIKAKAQFCRRARRQGWRSGGRAADRACKISSDERSSPVRQRVDDRGRTAVNTKSGHARRFMFPHPLRAPPRAEPPRGPSPTHAIARIQAGETMPVRGTAPPRRPCWFPDELSRPSTSAKMCFVKIFRIDLFGRSQVALMSNCLKRQRMTKKRFEFNRRTSRLPSCSSLPSRSVAPLSIHSLELGCEHFRGMSELERSGEGIKKGWAEEGKGEGDISPRRLQHPFDSNRPEEAAGKSIGNF
ncbi:hypothetical protein K523DRAFT_334948 [Schizophyllum commune Tattone D]|nr:hypothetical protein K523DRAFT_334948 [Schizophyllum commune Tattone D]